MMTLLELCQGLAKNVGLAIPTAVFNVTDRTEQEMVQCANDTGYEMIRRVDWGVLRRQQTLTGDDTDQTYTMSGSFDRLTPGSAFVVTATGAPVRQLTIGEWASLPAAIGDSRYYLMEGTSVRLWPYLTTAATVRVKYQAVSWVQSGIVTVPAFLDDDDEPIIPDKPFLMGMIARWRRQKGMDYADFEAEYEATLKDFADFDKGARI